MQNTIWAAILLWLMPGAVIANGLGQWSTPDQLQDWPRVVSIAALLLPIGLISVALGEFAVRGNGTGFPFDPPEKLVTTGVYALVSNPMQLGICSMMAVWGLVLQNPLITAMAGVAFFLFVVFKNVCNGSFAIGRRDPEWCSYQDAVPR
ncbi:MAG: hypothetical protein HOI34_17535 [Rhodospirillaceae bacterium]|nr:hypothetical protein [Rhodospirillaceae bacterium]